MLQRADHAHWLLTNLELSLYLTVNGRRMNDEARFLVSLLGVLPDGIAWQDLDAVLPGKVTGAAADLAGLGSRSMRARTAPATRWPRFANPRTAGTSPERRTCPRRESLPRAGRRPG